MSLRKLVTRLRDDLNNPTKPTQLVLLYGYNRTGKTRLSVAFKDEGKRKNNGAPDTLYFNAFTEDLFTWENDLENDAARGLNLNSASKFFDGFTNLGLEPKIDEYLRRYADFDFDFTYKEIRQGNESFSKPTFVSFSKEKQDNIKISRGEQNIFIWCVFMAICEKVLDGHTSYQWVKYLYIDDPISSLDDNNAIAVACDLAQLIRRAATRRDTNGAPEPLKVVFSSHHALFFNVMCNEMGRARDGHPKVTHKRYFLHRSHTDGALILRATEDTPFFHHVATLVELQRVADPTVDKLYTFHFNALRSIMEKTSSFFGHTDISFCFKDLDNEHDKALYDRALNLLSHGAYAIHDPTPMGDDNKTLFRRLLSDFLTRFQFALPGILGAVPAPTAPEATAPPNPELST